MTDEKTPGHREADNEPHSQSGHASGHHSGRLGSLFGCGGGMMWVMLGLIVLLLLANYIIR